MVSVSLFSYFPMLEVNAYPNTRIKEMKSLSPKVSPKILQVRISRFPQATVCFSVETVIRRKCVMSTTTNSGKVILVLQSMSVQLSFSVVQFFKPLHPSAHRGNKKQERQRGIRGMGERERDKGRIINKALLSRSILTTTPWFKLI